MRFGIPRRRRTQPGHFRLALCSQRPCLRTSEPIQPMKHPMRVKTVMISGFAAAKCKYNLDCFGGLNCRLPLFPHAFMLGPRLGASGHLTTSKVKKGQKGARLRHVGPEYGVSWLHSAKPGGWASWPPARTRAPNADASPARPSTPTREGPACGNIICSEAVAQFKHSPPAARLPGPRVGRQPGCPFAAPPIASSRPPQVPDQASR